MSSTLRASIRGVKGHLTQRLAKAENFLVSPVPKTLTDCQASLDTTIELSALIEKSVETLRAKDAEWIQCSDAIANPIEQEAERQLYEKTIAAADSYMTTLYAAEETLAKLATRKRKLEQRIADVATSSAQSDTSTSTPQVQTDRYLTVKPPKLVLPSYDGDPIKWRSFWGIFKANIHDRPGLSNIEKMSYLIPQLKGLALDVISGLLITDENYDVAVGILKQRFDTTNDRLLTMLFGQLKRLQRANQGCIPTRKMFDQCESIFRQMLQTGEDVDSSKTLSLDYLSKFHPNVFRYLEKDYHITGHSSLGEIRSALSKMLTKWESTTSTLNDLSIIAGTKGSDQGYSTKKEHHEHIDRDHGKSSGNKGGSGTQTSAMAAVEPRTFNCPFCDGSHKGAFCTAYPTAQARLKRVKDLGNCQRCTFPHKDDCLVRISCYTCGEKSHVNAICPKAKFPIKKTVKPGTSGAKDKVVAKPKSKEDTDMTMINQVNRGKTKRALFQTAKLEVVNAQTKQKKMLRCVFDNLSGRSYITESAASSLSLTSDKQDKLLVSVFGSKKRVEVPTRYVSIGLTKKDGTVKEIEVNTTPIISNSGVLPSTWPQPERDTVTALWKSGALADDPFDTDDKIDVLIGADYAWDFILGPIMQSVNDMSLLPTSFGLVLAGQILSPGDDTCNMTMLCVTPFATTNDLSPIAREIPATKPEPVDVDEYWKLESMGITDCPVECDDDLVSQSFEQTVQFEEGRYQVTWPWIAEKKELLPTNYKVAQRRFNLLAKRFQDDRQLLETYASVIKQQATNGVIERVPNDEVETSGTIHYLSHHPVIRTNHATTKLRVVYDASAKMRKTDPSLNECQHKGPTILPDLCQLLIRFRTHPLAICADVEKAFLQIGLQRTERDVTRFLWFENDTNPDPTGGNLATYRFCRVLFGMRSSPFLLGATLRYHLAQDPSPLAAPLIDDVYVDNVISGCVNETEALHFYQETKAIFERAGMNLTQFYSNCNGLMDKMAPKDRVATPTTKVLGLTWNGRDDTLCLGKRLDEPLDKKVSKRSVLQFIASVYDPLGFFQPVLFPAKLFLQQLWVSNFSWDSPLPQEKAKEWETLVDSLKPALNWTLDRYVGIPKDDSSLVIFGDASKCGFGAVVYLRNRNDDGWETSLLFAKSRLAPIDKPAKSSREKKRISIPRLELLATIVSGRLANFCRKALRKPEMETLIFTDSMCVWHWIHEDDTSSLKRFVANRVDEIQTVKHCQFHYVNTNENPADLLTRGKSGSELIDDRLWWKGPEWLSFERERWPLSQPIEPTDELNEELKRERKLNAPIAVLAATDAVPAPTPFNLNPNDFGTWMALIKRTATCVIACKKLVWNRLSNGTKAQFPKLCDRFLKTSDEVPATATDYENATVLWIKWSQHESFPSVFDDIAERKTNSLVRQLGIRIDTEGILRIHGRLGNTDLPAESKYPILLAPKSWIAKLIVENVHNRVGHAGVSHTLSELRRLYWLPRGRNTVRHILRNCLICRKFKNAQTFSLPPMPSWPIERVSRSTAFQYVGLDYFGPIKVKVQSNSVRKMWVAMFSCLAIRAVHLEPVFDATSEEFLQALIRFVSRRGCPHQIISDNAAQFRLTQILSERAWKRVPTDPSILSYAASNAIRWKFITELAPWQGGHYERLIGVIKSTMKTTIGRRLLSWTNLVTILCETEAIVNTRPITYVASDVDSYAKVLRPSDFLTDLDTGVGISDTTFPVQDLGEAAKHVASMWKCRKRHLDKMWDVWYREYLSILRSRSDPEHQQRRNRLHRSPREGEVAILKDEDLPRGCWKLVRVTKLIQGSDGKVRSVEIRLSTGVTLRRAVNFLVPLEIDPVNAENPHDQVDADQTNTAESHQADSQNGTLATPEQRDVVEQSTQQPAREQDTAHELNPSENNENDVFVGFSQRDIGRTEQLLRQFELDSEFGDEITQ